MSLFRNEKLKFTYLQFNEILALADIVSQFIK